jgi:hypothetical protein
VSVSKAARDVVDLSEDCDADDREQIELERSEIQDFVKELSWDDIKSGGGFTSFCV